MLLAFVWQDLLIEKVLLRKSLTSKLLKRRIDLEDWCSGPHAYVCPTGGSQEHKQSIWVLYCRKRYYQRRLSPHCSETEPNRIGILKR